MLILKITKCFINSKCKHKGFLSLNPCCNFYFSDSCSFPAECYFRGNQFMQFRSEQCFRNSQIWLKKIQTLDEVLTWKPRNTWNHAYDQYSSSALFLLQQKKHFNTSSAFWFWCWIARYIWFWVQTPNYQKLLLAFELPFWVLYCGRGLLHLAANIRSVWKVSWHLTCCSLTSSREMIELNVDANNDFLSLSSYTYCGILRSEAEKVICGRPMYQVLKCNFSGN